MTGASRGIGEALAIGLADHGTDVIICDLENESKGLANTHKQIERTGRKCWSYFLDAIRLNSLCRYNSKPTAVEYLVFPRRSSSPLIDFGEPILDGF